MAEHKKGTDEERRSVSEVSDASSPQGSDEELREHCAHDRQRLTPKQTADCAGTNLAEIYDNEEDGGS